MGQKTGLSKLARAALWGFLALSLGAPEMAGAHCDTMDGPVVVAARGALDKGEVTPVLKWVKKADEAEVRAAFKQARTVRTKGEEAKELADRHCFETVVRLHRASESEP
jgi:hypothetical protein